MNKTHVPDSPITSRQYHNRQVALHFCARHGIGHSVRSGTRSSAGRSVVLSVESRNVMRCFSVTPEKCELDLGNHET